MVVVSLWGLFALVKVVHWYECGFAVRLGEGKFYTEFGRCKFVVLVNADGELSRLELPI